MTLAQLGAWLDERELSLRVERLIGDGRPTWRASLSGVARHVTANGRDVAEAVKRAVRAYEVNFDVEVQRES